MFSPTSKKNAKGILHMIRITEKLNAMLLSIVMLFLMTQVMPDAKAISIDDSSVFLKQAESSTCTLAASAMMLRRRAIIDGNSKWSDITENALKPTAWSGGLKYTFSYSGMDVSHYYINNMSIANKKEAIISRLEKHPEGIVIWNDTKPHAVLATDYDSATDTIYCADPSGSTKRIALSSCSTLPGSGQNGKISGIYKYWYITNKSGWPQVWVSPGIQPPPLPW